MSVVTTVMVNVDSEDDKGRAALAEWREPQSGAWLGSLGDAPHEFWAGNKAPQVWLYAGAYNYLDLDEFLRFIASVPWEYPDAVQVFISGEWDTSFTIYNHRGEQVYPLPDGFEPPGDQ